MRLVDELDSLAQAYRDGRSLALLFDFDGTLSHLVTHPDLATCPEATLDLLASLAALPRVLVGIISGRALADLKSKISLPNLVYAGTSGLEMEWGDQVTVHPEAARFAPVLASAAQVASLTIRPFAGAWIEPKPFSFAVHYRQVRRDEVALCEQCLTSKLAHFSGVLDCLDGSLSLEVLPAIGWAKREALGAIITQHGQDVIPLYAGNDARDADAMTAAAKLGGVSIGVGPAAPVEAQHHITDVESLTEHLAALLARLTSS
jgi:trehalose 6-phosphate phosphatase